MLFECSEFLSSSSPLIPLCVSAQIICTKRGGADMAKLVHSMIRVMDASRSVAFYEKAFGLSVVDKLDFESFVLIYMVSE